MARTRTTKSVAQRIDLNYFKRSTPFKRARLFLVIAVPLLALAWIAWGGFSRDSRVYSSGRMSEAHAVLEKQCAACHLQKAGEYSAKAADSACLSCHDGPVHHEEQVRADVPACATCHVEHRGHVNIAASSNASCAACHANLRVLAGALPYYAHIRTLEDGHPEIGAHRPNAKDPGTILLNHFLHMKPIRRGPNGPIVQMDCSDCHRPEGYKASWPYADLDYVQAKVTYTDEEVLLPAGSGTLQPRRIMPRAYMTPVRFATACANCHLLTFDKRFDIGVPHDKPEVIRTFLIQKFQEYIAAHPADLRVVRDPNRDLTGKPIPQEVRILTPAQWVSERTADAEELLWRKTCKQCHALNITPGSNLPRVANAQLTQRWMPHSRFDHDAHRGFSCTGCHANALQSKETSDVLIPNIATCKTCHAPGPDHAEARCFECHTYHNWAKRKEVKPTYTLPSLQTSVMRGEIRAK
ncbi:MAG TPA: hypothetical protein VL128_14920 [Candidatus Eisenbacteria bacterium]|nr:hypothetical protein [Candidatus Eisenbacteria bacterium]